MKKNCITCNKEYAKPSTCSLKEWGTRKFCSYSCRRFTQEVKNRISATKKSSPDTLRGERHHNWKGGVWAEQDTARHSAQYKTWRDSVYRKDNWSCADCGIHCQKGNIVAHHLVSFADHPELRYEINNGQVLCRPCHARVHAEELQLARIIYRSRITHT